MEPPNRDSVTESEEQGPFAPPNSRGGILSLRGRERIPGVPVGSHVEALSTGKARGPGAPWKIVFQLRDSPKCPYKTVKFTNKSVCSDCSTDWFFPLSCSVSAGLLIL